MSLCQISWFKSIEGHPPDPPQVVVRSAFNFKKQISIALKFKTQLGLPFEGGIKLTDLKQLFIYVYVQCFWKQRIKRRLSFRFHFFKTENERRVSGSSFWFENEIVDVVLSNRFWKRNENFKQKRFFFSMLKKSL